MTFALSADASVNALQQTLLEEAALTTEGPNKASRFPDNAIADMLTTARIECIDSMEAYFTGDLQPTGCISARNEGAAISLILQQGIAGALHKLDRRRCSGRPACMPYGGLYPGSLLQVGPVMTSRQSLLLTRSSYQQASSLGTHSLRKALMAAHAR